MTNTLKEHSISQALNWRYAVKKYNPAARISDADWALLKEALVKAPSSYGLQPWKFLVVENSATRALLRPASWGQSQITDASHLVVVLARETVTTGDVDRYLARIADVRGVPLDSLSGFRDMLLKLTSLPAEQALTWTQKQAYIAMGFLLETAALLRIDSTPMEGFEPKVYDKILGLEGSGWRSTAVVALGYRHPEDAAQTYKKVRFEEKDIIEVR